jgi:hypothetical protein
MPVLPLPRRLSVLGSVLAVAGIVLAVASCSHITPIGPGPTPVAMPPARHLGSPIIMQVMRNRPPLPTGGCPAGWVTVSLPPGAVPQPCYRPVGMPVTINSAAVSSVSTYPPPPGQPKVPTTYRFTVDVPAAHVAAATAIIRQAYDSGRAVGISVAGRLWEAAQVGEPFSAQQFQVILRSRNQALRLYRLLVPSG